MSNTELKLNGVTVLSENNGEIELGSGENSSFSISSDLTLTEQNKVVFRDTSKNLEFHLKNEIRNSATECELGFYTNASVDYNDYPLFSIKDFGNGGGALLYRPIENSTSARRHFVTFRPIDNDSYPIITNRTPNGKLVLASAPDAGGSDIEHIVINGGNGNGPLTEIDIEIKNANLKSGGNYIYKHHTCTQLGVSAVVQSVSTTADCGTVVSIDGQTSGCSQGLDHNYNWWNYKLACERAGMRLCTDQEIEDYAIYGTGCSHDYRACWTSTMNSSGQYKLRSCIPTLETGVAGSSWYEYRYPHDSSTAVGTTLNEIGIRCCGQNSWG